jgi:ATP-dependent Clp protease ATP-binding subunit ClpC
MFDRFTEHAKSTFNNARLEAQQLDHSYLGTEHILLGLTRVDDDRVLEALVNLGVEPQAIRRELEALCKRGPGPTKFGAMPFTPRAKRVIELALEEATRLGHRHIDTEHFLVALLAEREGLAAIVLTRLGVELDALRTELRRQR